MSAHSRRRGLVSIDMWRKSTADFWSVIGQPAPAPGRVSWVVTLSGVAVGAGTGLLADELTCRRVPDRRPLWAAVGLVAAALVYPVARRGPGHTLHESWMLLMACFVCVLSARCSDRSACSLLGASWMCHALFDLACGHGASTWRLPRWYPAWCAGFDVAYGARLLRRPEGPAKPKPVAASNCAVLAAP